MQLLGIYRNQCWCRVRPTNTFPKLYKHFSFLGADPTQNTWICCEYNEIVWNLHCWGGENTRPYWNWGLRGIWSVRDNARDCPRHGPRYHPRDSPTDCLRDSTMQWDWPMQGTDQYKGLTNVRDWPIQGTDQCKGLSNARGWPMPGTVQETIKGTIQEAILDTVQETVQESF